MAACDDRFYDGRKNETEKFQLLSDSPGKGHFDSLFLGKNVFVFIFCEDF